MIAHAGKPVAPDANSTLRVTFGHVKGYAPRDGLLATPFTTLAGMVAKHTNEEPFDLPPEAAVEATSRLFRALGDPGRLRVLLCLRAGEACVSELAAAMGEGLSTVSQRLRLLHLDGLALTMLGVITGVGFLIHLFASWYMRGEEGY